MSDLISREWLLKQPLDTSNYPSNYVKSAPSADIMECAKALKNACGKIDCAFCPINYWCGVEDIRPFGWNLPEGEKGGE